MPLVTEPLPGWLLASFNRHTEVASGSLLDSSMSSSLRPSRSPILSTATSGVQASFLPTGTGVSISFHAEGLGFLDGGVSVLAEVGGSSVVVHARRKHSASHRRDMNRSIV